jgi:hypothetical protein
MTEGEERRIAESMREALRRSRGHASFFEWAPNRDLEEWGVVTHFQEALQHRGQPPLYSVSSRGRGNDPPDCEAVGFDGKPIAIEVTELVDPSAIVAYKAKKLYEWNEWSREKLQEGVARLLNAKASRRRSLKGGPYSEYIVLIYTDEPMLPYDKAMTLLDGMTFATSNRINRAFLLISYDPSVGYCPYLPLRIDA